MTVDRSLPETEPDGLVFVTCAGADRFPCHEGAIYVPEIGPMGDGFMTTVEEAAAAGDHWRWRYFEADGVWLCRRCQDLLDAVNPPFRARRR